MLKSIDISDSGYRNSEDNVVISLQENFTEETISYNNIKKVNLG